jgi:hypothetical protein
MHAQVNLSGISEKLVRAEPSVIVSRSNFKASEKEKGCGYLGWYSMVYVLIVWSMPSYRLGWMKALYQLP